MSICRNIYYISSVKFHCFTEYLHSHVFVSQTTMTATIISGVKIQFNYIHEPNKEYYKYARTKQYLTTMNEINHDV